jgi:hypothetical protein
MSSAGLDRRSRKYLLGLHETVNVFECGHWAAFRAAEAPITENRPHGLKYALTLHRRGGHRVIGYDNAHLPENLKAYRSPDGKKLRAYDHRHWRDAEAAVYVFESPGKLLEDFWEDVYRYLMEEGIP